MENRAESTKIDGFFVRFVQNCFLQFSAPSTLLASSPVSLESLFHELSNGSKLDVRSAHGAEFRRPQKTRNAWKMRTRKTGKTRSFLRIGISDYSKSWSVTFQNQERFKLFTTSLRSISVLLLVPRTGRKCDFAIFKIHRKTAQTRMSSLFSFAKKGRTTLNVGAVS